MKVIRIDAPLGNKIDVSEDFGLTCTEYFLFKAFHSWDSYCISKTVDLRTLYFKTF